MENKRTFDEVRILKEENKELQEKVAKYQRLLENYNSKLNNPCYVVGFFSSKEKKLAEFARAIAWSKKGRQILDMAEKEYRRKKRLKNQKKSKRKTANGG